MRALIVYGSRYGTAAEIANEMGKVIEEEGVNVDVVNSRGLKDCDVSPYNLVVVGSGIKMGKWTKGTLKFLKNNKSALENTNVALFVTCGAANDEKTVDEGWDNYLKKVAEENLAGKPMDMLLCGSVYEPNPQHGLLYKITNRFIKKELEKQGIDTTKRHDYRNWEEIQTWARSLANKMKQ